MRSVFEDDSATRIRHLLLVTVEDPFNQRSWSGIPFSLREALERRVEKVTVFRPGPPSRRLIDVLKRIWFGGRPPRYPLWMTKASLRKNASQVAREIERVRPDAVLSISSQCIAMLGDTRPPVFLFSDAPWLAWLEAYQDTAMMPRCVAEYAARERRAARQIDGLFFGSQWAVSEAIRLYCETPDSAESLAGKLKVVPLGANWVPKASREGVLASIDARRPDELNLLFVGRDWGRKGGPLAIQIAEGLREAGHATRLHVVGCSPALPERYLGFVQVHGPLSIAIPEDESRLAELFRTAHFLVMPTTAECFGIAYADGAAFGVPAVAQAVHAVPEVVIDGLTGIVLPKDSVPAAYVERIGSLLEKPGAYRRMAVHARDFFESALSWDRAAAAIVTAISARVSQRESAHGDV